MASDTIVADETFEFGSFRLDTRKGTLGNGAGQVFLRPKAFGLLLHLASNMGRVVPKAELLDVVWPNVYVTEDSLTQSIREIRKALGEEGAELIRTVSRRGYMLVGPTIKPVLEVGTQPIVAVLRFRNDGPNPDDQSLIDGFAGDLINGLAGFGSVIVLARHSSFHFDSFRGSTEAADRIGADYLVEGGMRRSANAAAVTVNLVEARRLTQIWGERYETHDLELFDVQRDIAMQVINRLVKSIHEQHLKRTISNPPSSLAAYDLVVRGSAALMSYSVGAPESSRIPFEQAIEKDPGYALAYVGLAWAELLIGGFGRVKPEVVGNAEALARKAIALASDQSQAYQVLALAELLQRRHAQAESTLRRSLELNRYDADAVEHMGYLLAMRGKPVEALEWIDRAIRLNPIHPAWYEYDRSLALYLLGEYAASIEVIVDHPDLSPWVRTRIAAAFAQLDRPEDAARHMAKVAADHPEFSPLGYAEEGVAFESRSDREHLVEGVRRAIEAAGL